MKQDFEKENDLILTAAAFGRLCVETIAEGQPVDLYQLQPPSGGCVLKHSVCPLRGGDYAAAAFGRLCVETNSKLYKIANHVCSRLRAAVC